MRKNMSGDVVYGLGFIASLVYYLQHATSISIGLLGIVKSLIWPALLVYRVLEYFKL